MNISDAFASHYQMTLAHAVSCSGVALHSGEQVGMRLCPAEADTGIVFVRTDVRDQNPLVPARYDLVSETRLGTTLTNEDGVKVMTVEHLMAALWGMGIDNCRIELEGPEIPIMDGSSEPFVFLIECAGVVALSAPRRMLEVLRPVMVTQGASSAEIRPYSGFVLDIAIEFNHASIARQHARYDFSKDSFKQALCRARTFGFAEEVEAMRAAGLARGGSLQNAIVLGQDRILNEEGLRYDDEFVRHKALDCVGDYFLAMGRIQGQIRTERSGHGVNNALLHAIFADVANYRWVDAATSARTAKIPAAPLFVPQPTMVPAGAFC